MSSHAVVFSTAGSEAEASRLAHALVEHRLAACVNVVSPMRSVYRWQGKIHDQAEWLLVIKTRRDRFEEVRQAIRQWHSYEQPEVVMLEIADGDPGYLKWLDDQTARNA